MLTFSQALIIFTATLIPIYLVLLVFSERAKKQEQGKSTRNRTQTTVIFSLLLIEFATISLLHTSSFRATSTYLILILLIASLLLYTLRSSQSSSKVQSAILLSAIMYHFALLYSPPFGIEIDERTAAMAMVIQEGRWDPEWRMLHPTYNPLPMDIGLLDMLSLVTSISHISQLNIWIIDLCLIVAYDLILYYLTKQITGSQLAGVLVIFILASTPPANITRGPLMWMANMLVLLSSLAMIRAMNRNSFISNIVVANVSYVAAIFMYASAALAVFLLVAILASNYLVKRFAKRGFTENRLLHTALPLFAAITLTRWMYTAGALESVLPTVKSFVMQMCGYVSSETAWIPLYDRTVDPVQAYTWSIPVAMASALIFYSLIRRRMYGGDLPLAFFGTGAMFLLYAFLVATATGISSSNAWRSMYPAFVFLMPAAAVVGRSILRSPSKVCSAFLVGLMIISVVIAVNDPMVSPQRYYEVRRNRPAGVEDYLEAVTLSSILPVSTDERLLAPYEIRSSISYLKVVAGVVMLPFYGGKVKSEPLRDAVLHGVVIDGVVYVLASDVKPYISNITVSIFYDSGRHILFKNASRYYGK